MRRLYTVTAPGNNGFYFIMKHRTHKQAIGLVADLKAWGIDDAQMIPEPTVPPYVEEAHRHAVQMFVAAVILAFVIGVVSLKLVDVACESHAGIRNQSKPLPVE